jgi:hypothetical protein
MGGVCVLFIYFRRLQRVKMDTRPKVSNGNDLHDCLWNHLLHRKRRKHIQMNKSLAKYEAFKTIIQSGKAKSMSHLIYKSLLVEPRTILHFRDVLKIPHQSCTGMLSTLEDTGWVYKQQTIKIQDKSYTLYNAEIDPQMAKQRAIQVDKFKKQEWINRGFKNGWFDEKTANEIAIQLKLGL